MKTSKFVTGKNNTVSVLIKLWVFHAQIMIGGGGGGGGGDRGLDPASISQGMGFEMVKPCPKVGHPERNSGSDTQGRQGAIKV